MAEAATSSVLLESCSTGSKLNEVYHKKTCTKSASELISINRLDKDKQDLLQLRTGIVIDFVMNSTICKHHEKVYISRYENLQTYCNDPFKRHAKHITSKLLTVIYPTSLINFRSISL